MHFEIINFCKSCGRAVKEGLKKCLCGGLIAAVLVFHVPKPHTHLEPYRPAPIKTITMIQTSTTYSFGR